MPFKKIFATAHLAYRIGLWNVFRVLRYRIELKLKLLRFKPKEAGDCEDTFFALKLPSTTPKTVDLKAFGWRQLRFCAPPDWHSSVLNPNCRLDKSTPWPQALASVPPDVDVKEIWELSRFYWVPQLALQARNGDPHAAATLNLWLKNWDAENPPYRGVNWSCGQEAGIRILHCAQAAIILDEVDRPQDTLVRFLANSAARIAPTLHYALGQANNHGSAESVALFVAGSWLEKFNGDRRATYWKKLGRRWLENRAKTLILDDGCSNQYSTNYHRAVLDTYCFAEVWRRLLEEKPFSAELTSRMRKATDWLYQITDEKTGAAPAFGANDGSLLLSPLPTNHHDFRPSVQLGSVLFHHVLAYDSNEFNELLQIYGLQRPTNKAPARSSQTYNSGGYIVLRQRHVTSILRFPNYSYRPSHSDALHLEFHLAGKPLLFDGGTYSYASTEGTDLSGVSSHNAIEFDGLDHMRKISRFLYADWLQRSALEQPSRIGDQLFCAAAFKDSHGHAHRREICLDNEKLVVKDAIKGFAQEAIMRWRLPDVDYELEGNTLLVEGIKIHVKPSEGISQIRARKAFYAPFYLKMEPCLVLEVVVSKPSEVVTTICFQ